MQRAPPKTDITTLPLKPTNKPTESRPIPNAKSFFTRSFAGMTEGGAYPPRADGLPRTVVTAPSVIPAKAGIQGGEGRGLGVRLGPTSQALRPHGSRNRDTNMDSRFRGNDGRGGRIRLESVVSLGPLSQPPSSFPRKRESRAGKDGSLASASSRRHRPLVPTEAGSGIRIWIPAFAGMTKGGPRRPPSGRRHRPPSSFPCARGFRALGRLNRRPRGCLGISSHALSRE